MITITFIDWVMLGVLLLSAAFGLWRGLVFEILSLLNWVAAFLLANWVAPELYRYMPLFDRIAEPLRFAAAFLLVFISVLLTGGLLAALFRSLIAAIGLSPVDRGLGGLFGLLRGVVLLLAVAVMINQTSVRTSPWWRDSAGAAALNGTLKVIRPWFPARFEGYLA